MLTVQEPAGVAASVLRPETLRMLHQVHGPSEAPAVKVEKMPRALARWMGRRKHVAWCGCGGCP